MAATRRRGAQLRQAILEAAWLQLRDHGLSGFTIETIATRAHTSKPVLYRRWPDRGALLVDTLRDHLDRHPLPVPDTGSLRGDLLALLTVANRERADVFELLGLAAVSLEQLHLTPADVRDQLMAGHAPTMDAVLAHARERGEIGPEPVPERVRDLPFALLRAEVLMTMQPAADAAITEIVDEILLPLLAGRHTRDI